MISHQKTINYAKALFAIPGSQQEIQERQQDLEQIGVLLTDVPEVLIILSHPGLIADFKLALLNKMLQREINRHVCQLLTILIKQRKTKMLRQIANEYHKLAIYNLDEIEVEVTSSHPLTEAEKKQIEDKLQQQFEKTILLIEKIDPSLLGGFTLLVHDQLLDLSLKRTLTSLKKQILKGML